MCRKFCFLLELWEMVGAHEDAEGNCMLGVVTQWCIALRITGNEVSRSDMIGQETWKVGPMENF